MDPRVGKNDDIGNANDIEKLIKEFKEITSLDLDKKKQDSLNERIPIIPFVIKGDKVRMEYGQMSTIESGNMVTSDYAQRAEIRNIVSGGPVEARTHDEIHSLEHEGTHPRMEDVD
jgi:hypothetical protein